MTDKYVLHVSVNTGGGVGTVIKNLINEQLKSGYSVGVAYLISNDSFLADLNGKVDLIKVEKPMLIGRSMLFGVGIRKIYNRLKLKYPDKHIIIHCHNVATIGLISNIKNIPIVCTIHGISGNKNYTIRNKISLKIYIYILKKLVKYKKTVCAVSMDTAKYYNKYIKNEYIKVVMNGININKIERLECINKDKFIIGHIGDISTDKGVDILIKAFKIIEDRFKKDMKLILVGGKANIDIESEIAEQEDINYLGEVPNASQKVIPRLDVLVLASKSEGLPMVILEAMALGIPVIATNVGGIGEVINNGINGVLVEKNEKEISNQITNLFLDRNKYIEISKNALEDYRRNFTSGVMNLNYIKLYYNLK